MSENYIEYLKHRFDVDWDFASEDTPYGADIRDVGDHAYSVLKQHQYDPDGLPISDFVRQLAGAPADINGLRGVIAYIARKAVQESYVLVTVPVAQKMYDTTQMLITDYEVKLLPLWGSGDLWG